MMLGGSAATTAHAFEATCKRQTLTSWIWAGKASGSVFKRSGLTAGLGLGSSMGGIGTTSEPCVSPMGATLTGGTGDYENRNEWVTKAKEWVHSTPGIPEGTLKATHPDPSTSDIPVGEPRTPA